MTKALILAAGRGTRLAPLTDNKPKCLVELNGMSLLGRQIATLWESGITDVTVIGGYRIECIKSTGVPTVVNGAYASSNMVFTLFCASHLMADADDLIVSYGDIVYEPRVLKALLSCDAPVCVSVDKEWRRYWNLRMDDPLADAETLKVDTSGRLLELGKKPRDYGEIQAQYMGLFKVSQDFVPKFIEAYEALNPEGPYDGLSRKQMYMTSFLQHLIDTGWMVQSVSVANGWLMRVYRLSRGGVTLTLQTMPQ